MLFRHSLLQEPFSTAAGAFLILLGVVIAQRSGYLNQIATKGIWPNDAISTKLGFNIIKFLPMFLSLSLFLAILLTLSRCYGDSEMIILFSSGLSVTRWIRPILISSISIVILISFLSLFVTPWITNKVEDFRLQFESRDYPVAISPSVFKESAHTDRVFFVECFDELGNFVKNNFMQTIQHQKLGIIVAAEGSHVIERNDNNFLVMQNGHLYQGSHNEAEYPTTEFEKYTIPVEEGEAHRTPLSTQAISSSVLIQNKNNTNISKLQWRLTKPISALIFALLAIPLSALIMINLYSL